MIVNCTPHPVVVINGDEKIVFPASGTVIRLASETVAAGSHDGVLLTKTVFGSPTGLPAQAPGTLLIVSQLVKSALPERTDLVVPAEVVRDSAGNIIGCKSLGL